MATIKDKAQEILDEKNNKIIPDNFIDNVTIFGKTGNIKFMRGDFKTSKCATDDVEQTFISSSVVESDTKQYINENSTVSMKTPYNILSEGIGITPDKIKKGETILDVIGTYEGSSNVKIYEDYESLENDKDIKKDDIGIILYEEKLMVNPYSVFDKCLFTREVILPNPCVGQYTGKYISANGEGYFDGNVQLTPNSFVFNGYGDKGEIRIEYNSYDGVVYHKVGDEDELVKFGVPIKYDINNYVFNDYIGNFMINYLTIVDSLYRSELSDVVEKDKLYPIDLSSIQYNSNNIYSVGYSNTYIDTDRIRAVLQKTDFYKDGYTLADIVYTNHCYFIYPYHSGGASYVKLLFNCSTGSLNFALTKASESSSAEKYVNIPADVYMYDEMNDIYHKYTDNDYNTVLGTWGYSNYTQYNIAEIGKEPEAFCVRYWDNYYDKVNELENMNFTTYKQSPISPSNSNFYIVDNNYFHNNKCVYHRLYTQLDELILLIILVLSIVRHFILFKLTLVLNKYMVI